MTMREKVFNYIQNVTGLSATTINQFMDEGWEHFYTAEGQPINNDKYIRMIAENILEF